SRVSWLAGRLAWALLVLGGLGVLAGLLAWAGAAGAGAGVGLGRLLAAGLNVVPPSVCVLGAGVLAFGLWPRAGGAFAYGTLAWSFLVELVGGVGSARWLLDTSVLHQMAPAPATSPDWASAAALLAVGTAAMVVGALAFARRDVTGI